MVTKQISIEDASVLQRLFGTLDENIKEVVAAFDVQVVLLSGVQHLQGDESNVNLALKVLDKLTSIVLSGDDLDTGRVRYICQAAKSGLLEEVDTLLGDVVTVTAKGKPVKSKTVGQKKYVDAIKNNIITFGIGPAGTGKTYLAVALAVASYKAKRVEKIILTRPAVEAGEKLGFLPGDLAEKVNPYLRPLYDALSEMFGHETYTKLIEKGAIEIAPLAYMRGRTLSNAFIILDEAQNTTKEQIKMFLTRLGENSKMVLTGDLTQVDLPTGKVSGLRYASKILAAVKDIGVIKFSEKDVVRHPLVQLIVKAYEEAEDKSREDKKRK